MRNNIDWSKGKANILMQRYVDEIRAVEAKYDRLISEDLVCSTDAPHICARRELNDNPDSKTRKKVCKVGGWRKRLFGR